MIHIIVGLGFGNEGKGSVTSYLCDRATSPIVIRYCEGHQVGHTVQLRNGKFHIFQSFGSGTLQGIPTYWSRYCTFYPIGFVKELLDLQKLKLSVEPRIYVDPLTPVTTLYDVLYNQALEMCKSSYKYENSRMGVGLTFERHETINKLFFRDLWFPDILNHKLEQIKEYYLNKIKTDKISRKTIESYYKKNKFKISEKSYLDAVNIIRSYDRISEKEEFNLFHRIGYRDFIFEGAQGTLLDMNYGLFPFVTRSNTTVKNAFEILKRNGLSDFQDRNYTIIHYVIRCYVTRYDTGPLFTEGILDFLKKNQLNNQKEKFRKGCLDRDLLIYALKANRQYYQGIKEYLYITCIDELKKFNNIKLRNNQNDVFNITIEDLANILEIDRCFISESPLGEFSEIIR